jgi:hypothetical protein
MGANWKQLAGQKIVQRHMQLAMYIQLSSGVGFENSFSDLQIDPFSSIKNLCTLLSIFLHI